MDDCFSSGLSSVFGCSVVLSELDEAVGGAAEAVVVLGAEVEGEGCGAAEVVLDCKTIINI